MDTTHQPPPTQAGEESAAPPPDVAPQYVNYLDVKLHRIEGLPADWYSEETDGPAYGGHPFRYEVSLAMPHASTTVGGGAAPKAGARPEGDRATAARPAAPVAVFTHGRLLAPLPQYQQYVAAAVPPPIAAMDDAGPLQDVPETLEPPVAAGAAAGDTAASRASMAFPDAAYVASGAATPAPEAQPTPPVVLWVATEKTDAASLAAMGPMTTAGGGSAGAGGSAAASERKARKKMTLAASNTTTSISGAAAAHGAEAVPLPLPDKGEAAPCVARIPLDAAQQSYLETLLNEQQPLTLLFRRVLRPGAPADWEDFNAHFFQASIPVSLAPFAEPGSLHLEATVPLRPPRPEDQLLQQSQQQPHDAGDTTVGSATTGTQQSQQPDPERAKKKLATRRNKTGIPPKLYEDIDTLSPHPYTTAGTAAVVSLSLQRTLTRLAIDRVRPAVTPQQLIPLRSKALLHGGASTPAANASTSELIASTIEDIARKILRDYKGIKQQHANGAGAALPTADMSQTEKETWRSQFLQFFQSSGQLVAYKAQLTPLVVRLVHERFAESREATRERVSQLTNELYVYLLECTHATLHRLVDSEFAAGGGGGGRSPTGHAHAAPPSHSTCTAWRNRALEAEASGDFALAATYHQARINCACASADRASEASECVLPNVWTEAANFYVRVGDSVKAEQCYREALASDATHLPALLGYGMLLMAYGRLSEAAVFTHGAADVAPQHALVWACIALLDDLYMFELKEGSPLFELEKAKWVREHRYAVQQAAKFIAEANAAGGGAAAPAGAIPLPSMQSSQTAAGSSRDGAAATSLPDAAAATAAEEAVYLACARYAVQLFHHDLANVCLARCQQGSFEVEALYARIFTQGGQHREALNVLAEMDIARELEHGEDGGEGVKGTRRGIAQDMLTILRATCEEALGRTGDAIKSYKDALCRPGGDGFAAVAPYLMQSGDEGSSEGAGAVELLSLDPVLVSAPPSVDVEGMAYVRLACGRAYLRLGSLLLAASKYKDALGVFSLGLQAWRTSSSLWLGAGIAYHRIGNPVAAEECLNESNCLDPMNPRTWAYLALIAIRNGGGGSTPAELEQSLQQAIVHGLSDPALWAELGRELLLSAGLPQLSEVCLRRAMSAATRGESGKGGSGDHLVSVSAYHLAHALAQMSRWDEARVMLEQVARTTKNEVLKAKAEEELRDLPLAL